MLIPPPSILEAPVSLGRFATYSVAASGAANKSDYDYVCDGTADDVQINTAIGALSAGGKIVLSEGTFNLAATVVVNVSNAVLEGQGASTILVIGNSLNINAVELGTGAGSFTQQRVLNLTVDGNAANQSSAGHGIAVKADAASATISGCQVINTYFANIALATAPDTTITGNKCDASGHGYPNIGNPATGGDRTRVTGNHCTNGDTGGIYLGAGTGHVISDNFVSGVVNDVSIFATDHCVVTGNYVDHSNNSTSTSAGILSNDQKNTISANIVIVEAAARFGIIGGVKDRIVGNIVDTTSTVNDAWGIYHVATQCEITDNDVLFTSDSGTGGGCIHCDQYDTVSGNLCQLAGARNLTGILLSASDVTCGDNIVVATGSGTTVGIEVDSSATSVTGNEIHGATTGINITANQVAVVANTTKNCASGIVASSAYLTVTGNTLVGLGSGSGEKALVFTGLANSVVANNVMTLWRKNAIDLSGCSNNTIAGNQIENCGTGTTNTYTGILLHGTSTYNSVTANNIQSDSSNKLEYGIREDTAGDGPNTIVANVVVGSLTTNISTQNGSTISASNLTA